MLAQGTQLGGQSYNIYTCLSVRTVDLSRRGPLGRMPNRSDARRMQSFISPAEPSSILQYRLREMCVVWWHAFLMPRSRAVVDKESVSQT